MTNITFKNGLPLLLQPAPGSDIGLVAADSGCCCPPPPPDRCWCGSFCSYFIELVDPSELAVKTTAIDCTNQSSSESKTIPTLLAALFAVTGQEIWPTAENQSTSIVSNFGSLAASSGCKIIGNDDFVEGDPGLNYQLFSARRSAVFSVACEMDPESGQPVMKGRLSLTLEAGFSNFYSLGGYMGSEGVRRTYYGEFDIPSTCVVSPERECFPEIYDSPEFLRIDTPLEITISGDGTSSLGSLDLTADETFGDGDTGLAEDAIGVLAEATSYTFRITARENCEALPDPCTVLIDGVRVSVSDFDPLEVITAEWRGLSAPGRNLVIADGVVIQDIDGVSYDGITDITTAGCDAPSQTDDVEAVYIAPGGSGIVNACATGESIAKYQTLVCEVVNENTARLYGGIATVKVYTPCEIGGAPSGDDILEENQWSWECLLENGIPGAVTVSPSVGARYFNADPVVCAVTHEPPVVTLDFVP